MNKKFIIIIITLILLTTIFFINQDRLNYKEKYESLIERLEARLAFHVADFQANLENTLEDDENQFLERELETMSYQAPIIEEAARELIQHKDASIERSALRTMWEFFAQSERFLNNSRSLLYSNGDIIEKNSCPDSGIIRNEDDIKEELNNFLEVIQSGMNDFNPIQTSYQEFIEQWDTNQAEELLKCNFRT